MNMPTKKTFAEMIDFHEKPFEVKLSTLVRSAARTVRDWLEDYDNLQRNPKGDMNGYCAIASARLWRELHSYGIKSEIHIAEMCNGSHVFVIVDDFVVDVTATQFNEFHDQPIVILHRKLAEVHDYYQSTMSFDSDHSDKDLIKYQRRTQWHCEQIAFA